LVQGEQAASQLVDAIQRANRDARCDVLLVTRGGGSLEDLWCFNAESVARAIFASRLPIVSAVGHEIDFTIADFVADHRAATPSAAAELLSPDRVEIDRQFNALRAQLADAIGRRIRDLQQRNDFLSQRLRHPGQRLGEQRRHLEHLTGRLLRAQNLSLDRRQLQLAALDSRVQCQHPHHTVKSHKDRLQRTTQRLHLGIAQRLQRAQQRYTQTTHLLDAVSPLKTVARGYAIVRDGRGAVVKSVTGVRSGDQLKAQIGDGEIVFAVTNTTALTLNGERQS
jgi:exodeoxyribonuclease VII large subunit